MDFTRFARYDMACPMNSYSGAAGSEDYVIHDFFDPSTKAWQYIIVDPGTRSCVLIDPVLDHTKDRIAISTQAADRLLSFVKSNSYRVDIMLETLSSSNNNRSGAWYLRSQLLKIQGHAPRVCGTQAAQPFGKLFARKYGFAPSTNSDEEFVDGDSIHVGHMKITMLQLPGLQTPDGRAYQIGENVFGAHSVASLKTKMQQNSASVQAAGADGIHRAWSSFQKVLGMPAHYRLYFDQESGAELARPRTKVKFGGADEQVVEGRPYATVAECRPTGDEIRAMAVETEVLLEAESSSPAPAAQVPKQKLRTSKSVFFSRSKKS